MAIIGSARGRIRGRRRGSIGLMDFIFLGTIVIILGVVGFFTLYSPDEDIPYSVTDEENDEEPAGPKAMDWKSYNSAVENSGSSGKIVLVDFFATWCEPCERMDENTYSDSRIIETSSQFECAKVDVDRESDLANQYGVSSIPLTLFLTSEGDEMRRVEGYVEAEEFLNIMNSVLE